MGSRKRPTLYSEAEEHKSISTVAISEDNSNNPKPYPSASCNNITVKGRGLGVNEQTTTPLSNKPWYGRSWPRGSKPSSVTTLENESTSIASNIADDITSEIAEHARKKTKLNPSVLPSTPSPYLSRSVGSSKRSLPLAATITKLNVVSKNSELSLRDTLGIPKLRSDSGALSETTSHSSTSQGQDREKNVHEGPQTDGATAKNCAVPFAPDDKPKSTKNPSDETFGWLRWSSNAADFDQNIVINDQTKASAKHMSAEAEPQEQQQSSSLASASCDLQVDSANRPWIGLWRAAALPLNTSRSKAVVEASAKEPDYTKEPQSNIGTLERDNEISEPAISAPVQSSYLSNFTIPTSGWAFWTSEKPKDGDPGSKGIIKNTYPPGLPLQLDSESAVVEDTTLISGKRKGSQPLNTPHNMASDFSGNKFKSGKEPLILASSPNSGITEQPGPHLKQNSANLLLPSIKSTYRTMTKPSLMQRINYLLQYHRHPDVKHVNLQEPGFIKKALAIGVHGYFPAPLIRSVFGQPTGTSMKFANGAACAIERWTKVRGYPCEVEKVALEGEGKIAERVDILWKLMLNWIENIRKADFVMIACHSQGVPVAVMLVAKLIAFGCVNQSRISICALAGVNLGPFADYKSRWIGGSAGELFDFAHSGSQVTKDYEVALNAALAYGVRVVYIGSIDDQLVSLESSTFGIVSHPYIYRAVFVDGRIHAPDFLTHLIGFALKLRNLGISDHGLIRELSSPLAGSLYSGEGHSRIYEDDSVYDLAVEFALETTSIGNVPFKIHRAGTQSSQNPYILPFAMRGLLEEEHVRMELQDETLELLRQFDDWKPSSKVLKDVKFRLEGIRSKL